MTNDIASTSSEHVVRSSFHRELGRLQDEVLVLGSMVEKALSRSVQALRARDVGMARSIEAEDVLINRKRFEIEEAALLQIATQQPMARARPARKRPFPPGHARRPDEGR